MMYALWEIAIPLLIAFLLGVLLGWVIWRWRRTKVTGSEWNRLQERAHQGDRAGARPEGSVDSDRRITALTADVEVRDIEIAQLRKALADTRPKA